MLYALWRNGFFDVAAFQGGTSLRILYGLPRFSEHMDFILLRSDERFGWDSVLPGVKNVLLEFGVTVVLTERQRLQGAVKRAVVKDDSLAGMLSLGLRRRAKAQAEGEAGNRYPTAGRFRLGAALS